MMTRRQWVLRSGMTASLWPRMAGAQGRVARSPGSRIRLALNAYSFEAPLRAGSMTLEDVVHFCAEHGIDALDATGYYFRGYPKVPSDDYIYRLKRMAFVDGVAITGTGVRNDFAVVDPAARRNDVQVVKSGSMSRRNLARRSSAFLAAGVSRRATHSTGHSSGWCPV
jgi:hypothetical protein